MFHLWMNTVSEDAGHSVQGGGEGHIFWRVQPKSGRVQGVQPKSGRVQNTPAPPTSAHAIYATFKVNLLQTYLIPTGYRMKNA